MMEGGAHPPLSCRTSPPQGGRSDSRTTSLQSPRLRCARGRHESISPPEGEMPGRAEGGKPHPPSSLSPPQNK
ncbi:propionyl-coenzyme A carboxylase alpha polypeptide [Agrobacterium rosae]|nr:propionyl-coenzyme A carboxylase alpha polypeptide [Agrobacterium rosae]KAA3520147.1 propionyl-coenzyme A carboxylase alpha polypeptide [Agrobacterium rosae]MQB49033.1 propionyl-coenzyme A carboxylase alpha polypeptide [Agrobacterium rosae]